MHQGPLYLLNNDPGSEYSSSKFGLRSRQTSSRKFNLFPWHWVGRGARQRRYFDRSAGWNSHGLSLAHTATSMGSVGRKHKYNWVAFRVHNNTFCLSWVNTATTLMGWALCIPHQSWVEFSVHDNILGFSLAYTAIVLDWVWLRNDLGLSLVYPALLLSWVCRTQLHFKVEFGPHCRSPGLSWV